MSDTPWKRKADWQEDLHAVPSEGAAEEFKRFMERLRSLPPGRVVWHINADSEPEPDET